VLSFEGNKRLKRIKENVVKYLQIYIICEKKIRNKNFIVLLPFVCSTKYYKHSFNESITLLVVMISYFVDVNVESNFVFDTKIVATDL